MPQQMWQHTCSANESLLRMGTPICRTCGRTGDYDGWHPKSHEAMAQYQTGYRLKPRGRHRRMADELFTSVRVQCEACTGRGLREKVDGTSWQSCAVCRGLGLLLTKAVDNIEPLRRRVLAVYPDAAADPVPAFFTGPLAFDGAKQEIVNLAHAVALQMPHSSAANRSSTF
jgi:hypothetical protein